MPAKFYSDWTYSKGHSDNKFETTDLQRQQIRKDTEKIAALSAQVRCGLKDSRTCYFPTVLPDFIHNSPQKFWQYLSGNNPAIDGVPLYGIMCSESALIAEAFNDLFVSVFSTKSNSSLENTPLTLCDDIIISKDGIAALLLKLYTKKSCGPDEIPNEFLERFCKWVLFS